MEIHFYGQICTYLVSLHYSYTGAVSVPFMSENQHLFEMANVSIFCDDMLL